MARPWLMSIIEWLSKRSWCLSGIYNIVHNKSGQSVQADFLFENSRVKRQTRYIIKMQI